MSNCDLELRTDFQLAGTNKRIEYNDSATNYSGYNNRYIDANGTFDAGLALQEFARMTAEKRLVKEDTFATLTKHPHSDSHEAFLVNMLTTWVYSSLYTSSGSTDKKLTLKISPFSNSHAVVDAGHGLNEQTISIYLNDLHYFAVHYVQVITTGIDLSFCTTMVRLRLKSLSTLLTYCVAARIPKLILIMVLLESTLKSFSWIRFLQRKCWQ